MERSLVLFDVGFGIDSVPPGGGMGWDGERDMIEKAGRKKKKKPTFF